MLNQKTHLVSVSLVSITDLNQAVKLMRSLKVSEPGVKIMAPKTQFKVFRINRIRTWEANIIKQYCLSLGTDAAIERTALIKDKITSVLVFGTKYQLNQLCEKLKNQPFSLNQVSRQIKKYLTEKKDLTFYARNKKLSLKNPVVCGIINLTNDSFSGDGILQIKSSKLNAQDEILKKAREMIKAGAKILDIGGQSSRPGSKPICEKEEIKRVVLAVKTIRAKYKKIIISVDTYRYAVANAAIKAGADLINDITGLRYEPKIVDLIKKYKLGCVLMHMKGMPATMQDQPSYQDVVNEVSEFFASRIKFCQDQGISLDHIAIDPGIGFGKRLEDNLDLIKSLEQFLSFGCPIFLGLSRKSFLGTIINSPCAADRLPATLVATAFAVEKGAKIIRCHDVKETVQAIKVVNALKQN